MSSKDVSGGYRLKVYSESGEKIKEVEKEFKDLLTNNMFYLFQGFLQGKFSKPNYGFGIQFTGVDNSVYQFDSIDFTKCSGEAPEGDDSYGIVVGSGSTSPSLNDYKLENQIGKDVLDYGECSFQNFGSGNNLKPGLSRKFTNKGSSSVTVNEIGLIVEITGTQPSSSNTGTCKVLLMRDVISQISIPGGGILNVEYFFNLNPQS